MTYLLSLSQERDTRPQQTLWQKSLRFHPENNNVLFIEINLYTQDAKLKFLDGFLTFVNESSSNFHGNEQPKPKKKTGGVTLQDYRQFNG